MNVTKDKEKVSERLFLRVDNVENNGSLLA